MKSKQKPKIPTSVPKISDNQPLKKQLDPISWLYAALILSFIVFIRTIFNGFVNFDDDTGILANSLYHNFSISNIIAIFQNANLGMYAPISGVLYTFLYSISNGNPLIFHLSSLILHLINIVLVFNILKNIFSEKSYIFGFKYSLNISMRNIVIFHLIKFIYNIIHITQYLTFILS